jgi:hypothetical protein
LLNRRPSDEKGTAPQDERGLRLLQRARGLQGLTREQVERIAARLDAPVAAPRRRSLVTVLAAVALLLSAGTALAWATGTLQRLPVVRAFVAPRPAAPKAGRPSRAIHSGQPAALISPGGATEHAVTVEEGAPSTAEERSLPASGPRTGPARPVAVAHERRDRVAARPSPSGAASARTDAAPESSIAQEGESFADIFRRWRRDHDEGAALAALDFHDRSFAGGQLALESRLLRVEILLYGRRDREALAILDGLPIDHVNVPRGRELLTVRGELRIKAGRCEEGRADLASIGGGADALGERARNALTHCH